MTSNHLERSSDEGDAQTSRWSPSEALGLSATASLAIAQPLFEQLTRTPEFFVARGADVQDQLLLVLVLGFAVPALLALPSIVTRWLRPALGPAAFQLTTAVLAFAIGLRIHRLLGWNDWLLIATAAIAAGVFALVRHSRNAGLFLSYLAPALIAVPALFWFHPDTARARASETGNAVVHETTATAPIVVLLFDEWSATSVLSANGGIDHRRFPNLARVAGSGTWFSNFFSSTGRTLNAIPALLSGQDPNEGLLPTLADYPENLFTLVGGSYDLYATEPVTRLCPEYLNRTTTNHQGLLARSKQLLSDLRWIWLHQVAPASIRQRLPPISDRWSDFGDDLDQDRDINTSDDFLRTAMANIRSDRTAPVANFIDHLQQVRPRSLHFGHFLLPHRPWNLLANGHRYEDGAPGLPGYTDTGWSSDKAAVGRSIERYLEQVALVDKIIGDVVDTLKAAGMYDDTLLLIASDHGVTFQEGFEVRQLTQTTAGELLASPLLIKPPGGRAARTDERVLATADLLPLLAQELGIAIPWRSGAPDLRPTSRSTIPIVSDGIEEDAIDAADMAAGRDRARNEILNHVRETAYGTAFQSGPHSDLVGIQARSITQRPSTASVIIEGDELYGDFKPERHTTLHFVRGSLEGTASLEGRIDLAITLGGQIVRTVTATGEGSFNRSFHTFLPYGFLAEGANELEVFVIHERPDGIELEHAQRERANAELRLDADGRVTSILFGDQELPVDGRFQGAVNATIVEASGRVTGWAFSRITRRPADRILVFQRGRLLTSVHEALDLPWLVAAMGTPYRGAGFQSDFHANLVSEIQQVGVQVFAISEGRAGELQPTYPSVVARSALSESRVDGTPFEWLVVGDGSRIPIVDSRLEAGIDLVRRRDLRWVVFGWAADSETKRGAETVVAFKNGRYFSSFTPDVARPNLATNGLVRSGLEAFGFRGSIATEDWPDPRSGDFEFIAVSDGIAQRIPIPEPEE